MTKFYEAWAFVRATEGALTQIMDTLRPLGTYKYSLSLDYELTRSAAPWAQPRACIVTPSLRLCCLVQVGSCLATVERAWRTIQQREASCSCDRLARTESARPLTTGATLPLGLLGQQNTLRCRLVQKQENISCLEIVGHALESE